MSHPPTAVYLAKVAVNFLAVAALQGALIPLFTVLTGVPFLAHPAPIILAALLGNRHLGRRYAVVALAAGMRAAGLPLAAATADGDSCWACRAEATTLAVENDLGGAWVRRIQLLAAFAVIFLTVGIVLFDHAIEE